jgi:metal-responsive CopG/Arc/MetJ family transcriptional regulator
MPERSYHHGRIARLVAQLMNGASMTMHRPINITLPEKAVRWIDCMAAYGNRSSLIDEAVKHYIKRPARATSRND